MVCRCPTGILAFMRSFQSLHKRAKPGNWPDGWHEERLANKGVLWAFWVGPQQGMLVLNTHLSTRGAVKRKQLEELSCLFAELRSKFPRVLNSTGGLHLWGLQHGFSLRRLLQSVVSGARAGDLDHSEADMWSCFGPHLPLALRSREARYRGL